MRFELRGSAIHPSLTAAPEESSAIGPRPGRCYPRPRNSVYLPAAAGASVAIKPGPIVPARILELLERVMPTVFFRVPTVFDGLTRLESGRLPDSIRVVISAGEALSPQLFERFRSRFGLPLLDGLGAHRGAPPCHLEPPPRRRPGECKTAPRRVGGPGPRPILRSRHRCWRGRAVGAGPAPFAGYWKRPELTARARRGR
jgi:benzoate-CoA ligase